MKLIAQTYLLILIALSNSAYAEDISGADCSAEKTVPITLSSNLYKDTLRLTASGSPCIKGNIIVTITKDDGKEIFRETLKIANFYVDPIGVPASDIDHLLDRIVRGGSMTTASWPAYVTKPQPIDVEGEYSYTVSRKEFNALRKKNLPAFRLSLHYEVSTNIIYDSKKDKAVTIWEWGL